MGDGVDTNMVARLLLRERLILGEDRFVEIVVWQVPAPVRGRAHSYKYRFAIVVDESCVLRFDNEAGKGDHFRLGDRDQPHQFVSLDRLVADFWAAVGRWRAE